MSELDRRRFLVAVAATVAVTVVSEVSGYAAGGSTETVARGDVPEIRAEPGRSGPVAVVAAAGTWITCGAARRWSTEQASRQR